MDRRAFGKLAFGAAAGLAITTRLPMAVAAAGVPEFEDKFEQPDGKLEQNGLFKYQYDPNVNPPNTFLPGKSKGIVKSGMVQPSEFTVRPNDPEKAYVVVTNFAVLGGALPVRQGFKVYFGGPVQGVTLACGQEEEEGTATLGSVGSNCIHTVFTLSRWDIQLRVNSPFNDPVSLGGGPFVPSLVVGQSYRFEQFIDAATGKITVEKDGLFLGDSAGHPANDRALQTWGRGLYFEAGHKGADDFTRLDRIWAATTA